MLNALFPHLLPGITTWAEPEKAVYLRKNLTDETVVIGQFDPSVSGSTNRMRPCAEGLTTLGISALESCENVSSEYITIDEIGYLEAGNELYCSAVLRLMQKKRLVAAVRKQELPFLQQLLKHNDAFVVDLDDPFGSCACVIMASGLGKRFGGNKLMADFDGQPLISRALDATEWIFAKRIVVTRHKDVEAFCQSRGIPVILHALPHRSDTIRLGLEAVMQEDACMFLPGDQPLLCKETVASLVIGASADPSSIWRAAYKDTPGSPVVFPKWAFAELMSLPEGKGGNHVIRNRADQVRLLNIENAYELTDVDMPEDLEKLKKYRI